MFKTKEYHFIFEKRDKSPICVTLANHQVYIALIRNRKRICCSRRVVQNCTDEHECVSLIAHYLGMGYTLTKFSITRLTAIPREERTMLEHGFDIWNKGK